MEEFKLIINGRDVAAKPGMTVLEAASAAGIYIPTLCHHPDLKPYGGCRVCVVEIEGLRGFPTSCTTPALDGMIVHTETESVNKVRRTAVELLIADHPMDCLTCSSDQKCELQKVSAYLNIREVRLPRKTAGLAVDDSNPFFSLDRNKCILCARCTRACNEITGVGAIDMSNRGSAMKVATFGDGRLLDSICQSCGECVSHCPVGALSPKKNTSTSSEVETTCPYCGTGCSMILGVRGEQVVSVRGNPRGPANSGKLCVKGRFGIEEFIHSPERLTTPLVRKNGQLEKTGWDEALDLIANNFSKYQSEEIALISSARCTNEENYLTQKLARSILRTNNVDNCARVCHGPTVAGLAISFGSGAMTNNIKDIGKAACLIVTGSNTTAAHPVIGMEVKEAVQRGAKLIVINPLEINLCRHADIWLRLRPGTDIPLLMGMMRIIVEENLQDKDFIAERCENFEAFTGSLNNFPLDIVENITGVPQSQIIEAARMYAAIKPAAILYTLGITEHTHGTENVMSIANLAMLTGNIGKPGTGVNPLRGQNNVQGSCDMGALPGYFPGYQSVMQTEIREKFEKAWGCDLNLKPGLVLTQFFDKEFNRKIKAMYIVGEDAVQTEPDMQNTINELKRLDFLVVQDIFLTETAKLAHVVLPGSTFAEKDGTFNNTERRFQLVKKAIPPVGQCKPDWEIICDIAKRMGKPGFDYDSPSQILEEITSLTPAFGGISYSRLEKGGLQWPCPTPEHPGTPILHTKIFTRGKGKFMPMSYRPPAELPDKEYPLLLTTGRSLYHFHTGVQTRKVRGLNVMMGEEMVEINPGDAGSLGIADNDPVTVTSRRGQVQAKARVTESSPAGVVFMTFHFIESPTNVLTNPVFDPIARTPEYKVCAVRVEKKTD